MKYDALTGRNLRPRSLKDSLAKLRSRRRNNCLRSVETLEPRQLLAAAPIINEFMAANNGSYLDEDLDSSDWVEIYNAGDEAVDLGGWSLTDNDGNLTKWVFPSTNLAPGQHQIVFASDKNRAVSGSPLHTNFKLDADGEYLALVRPDLTIASEYAPYPRQLDNVSYGIGEDVAVANLIEAGASARVHVPTSGALGTSWTANGAAFNDASWTPATTGIGFETTSSSVLPPSGSPYYYGPYGPNGTYNLYQLVTTPLSFIAAEADARNRTIAGVSGHLITIGSSGEQNLARTIRLAGGADTWIGLTDREAFGGFEAGNTSTNPLPPTGTPPGAGQRGRGFAWTTGEPLVYMNWAAGAPDDNGGEDFAVMNILGQWIDIKTTEDGAGAFTRRYIVEYELGLESPPGAAAADAGDFKIVEVTNNGALGTVSDAVNSVESGSGNVVHYTAGTINHRDPQTNGSDRFVTDRAFATDTAADDNNIALRATAIVQIATAGDYTFGVTSDDGFRLRIAGATFTSVSGANTFIAGDTMEHTAPRGPADSLGVVHLEAGAYPIELTMFEAGGGAMVELYAAAGVKTGYDTTFRLVGDAANGGLPLSNYGDLIASNIAGPMHDVSSSVYVRIPFTADEPEEFDSLKLRAQYEDGFVAYLNGTEVARRNAPTTVAWNSTATAHRPADQAVVAELIDLTPHLHLLVDGNNTLAIHGLNRSVFDNDYLLVPTLEAHTSLGIGERYFANSTPATANDNTGTLGVVEDVEFSRERGFYDAAFTVRLSTDTDDAVIRYTTDGSDPTPTHGDVYFTPVPITTTTTLRAAAFLPGYQRARTTTNTYVFLDDVVRQTGSGFTPSWGGVTADYEMDPAIVNNPAYRDTIVSDLKSLPTMSIVLNEDDLFGTSGIYINPLGEGTAFERPASVELFYPNGTEGFQVNAGLRMFGGYSRNPGATPKHSFRLLFKAEYGPTKLQYPLFGDDAAEEFDTVVLRANFNDSWAAGNGGAAHVIDEWSRQTQRDMGNIAGDGTFVHLYVNGLYWGVFNPSERHDASFMSSYYGGDDTEWDAMHTFEVRDGNRTAWNTAISIASGDMTGAAGYAALQQYVDIDNLIDYVIMNIYGGNWDWPHNNWDAARRRDADGRFRFFSWDAEGNLNDVNADRSDVNAGDSPGYFYWRLRDNAEFRLRFADRLHKHFFNDGALTPVQAAARFSELAAIIDRATVAESARWGDARTEPPFDRNSTFVGRRDYMVNGYFPARTNIVLNQFRNDLLYPTVGAPLFSPQAATFDPGFALQMSVPGSQQYNNTTLVASVVPVRALVPPNGNLGTNWTQLNFNAVGWTDNTNTGVGYERAGTDTNFAALIGTNVGAQMDQIRQSVYMRIPFNIAGTPQFDRLMLKMKVDDGFIAYINGAEVARFNAPANAQWDPSATAGYADSSAVVFQDFDITNFRHLLTNGANVLAIHGLNAGLGSSDLIIMPELIGQTLISVGPQPIWYTLDGSDPRLPGGGTNPTAVQYTAAIQINASTVVKARVFSGGAWSALNEANYALDLSDLRVTEVHFNPAAPAPGGPYIASDFEFVELMNVGTQPLDLRGVTFTNGLDFVFPQSAPALGPGQRTVVVSNLAAFQSRYGAGITVAGEFTGQLDNNGETIALAGKLGDSVLSFRYADGWYDVADGEGFSLTLRHETTATNQYGVETNWRPSQKLHGSPGQDDVLADPGSVVINEVLANTAGPLGDRIELRNTTGAAIDVGGWFLSDHDLDRRRYRIPDGTSIPANGYLVLNEATSFGQAGGAGVNTAFSLSPAGGTLYLSSNDETGELGGYRDTEGFDGSDPEMSFGRHNNSTGDERLVAQSAQSFGAANPGPRVGPIVINEIMYHPAGDGEGEGIEYIELLNISSSAVQLYDSANPTNAWQFANGIQFEFPQGIEIPAGGYAIVADIVPILFRALHGIPETVQVFGPFDDGKLDNAGEALELFRPGAPLPGPVVPLIVADRVDYEDELPWPLRADGLGSALNRVVAGNYGDEVTNWIESTTGGTPGRLNIGFDNTGPTAPTGVTATVMSATRIDLSWTAATDPQTGVAQYQVFRNGENLGLFTGTTYSDTTVPAVLSGNTVSYEIRAFNTDGVAGPKTIKNVTVVGIDFARSTQENRLLVTFSENVTSASATNLANYSIDRNLLVLNATLGADNRTVTLVTTSIAPQTVYALQVTGVVGVTGNVLRPGTQSTFTLGESGFIVHMWDVNGGTDGALGTTTEALSIANNTFPAGAYTFSYNNEVTRPYINLGGPTSYTSPPLLPYPNGVMGAGSDNIVVRATSVVTIPAGTWTIDFGSDDGGQLVLPGITFTAKYGQDTASAANAVRFENGRGHGHTGGTFTIPGQPGEAFTTTLELVMFEGGGGDSVDLSIFPGTKAGFDASFILLQDGVQGWSVKTQGTPVNQPPIVVDVGLASTSWAPAFAAQFGPTGFAIPDGASQLAPAPHEAINQIKIRFSEDVNVQAQHLQVLGVNTANYAAGGFAAFTFDPTTDVATWTLAAPIVNDKIRLVLDDAITDGGGLALDGEWTTQVSRYSGNGSFGGDLSYRFNILSGDANQSNTVDGSDFQAVLARAFTAIGQPGYSPSFDLNGDGVINVLDLTAAHARRGTQLPAANPSPPAPSPAAAAEESTIALQEGTLRSRRVAATRATATDRVLDALTREVDELFPSRLRATRTVRRGNDQAVQSLVATR